MILRLVHYDFVVSADSNNVATGYNYVSETNVSVNPQMRLVMKSFSFIRENSTKLMHPWHKDDEDGPSVWYERQMDPCVGSFSKYLYFLFVPTLLYRDHYPR